MNDLFYTKAAKLRALSRSLNLALTTLFLFNASLRAVDIHFDEEYGSDGNVADTIRKAITEADPGDVLIFNSTNYNLNGGAILIDKAITIQGETPNDYHASAWGASGILTSWRNTGRITIASNNVIFRDISLIRQMPGANAELVYDILIDARHSTYLNPLPMTITQIQYTGIRFTNVVLSSAAYLIHAGNGIEANMVNVTFTEFRRIGFWTDRKGRIGNSRRALFDRCFFNPEDSIQFDDRAISLDAGNTEYPVIWNLNNTTVRNSYIRNSGIAYSRCHNATIEGCTFDDFEGEVDLVHIEEFSYNMDITGNTFNCNEAESKIFLIDRELQISGHINITNNIIQGEYNFFISSYAPHHITITGNDFTHANGINNHSINFTYYEAFAHEPLPDGYNFVSNNITITGNINLGDNDNSNIRVFFPNSGATYNISDYPENQRDVSYINPPQAFISNGQYEIINLDNDRRLASVTNSNAVTTSTATNNSVRWRSYWNSPYTYSFQNVETGGWLETHAGYTESDIYNNAPQDIAPFLITYGNQPKPFWCLVADGTNYEIFPGGNEKQSALAVDGNDVVLIFAKEFVEGGGREPLDLDDNAKWTFNRVDDLKKDEEISERMTTNRVSGMDLEVYPNPATDIVYMFFRDNDIEQLEVKIYDVTGNLVMTQKLFSDIHHAFDFSGLKGGTYLLKSDIGHCKKINVR